MILYFITYSNSRNCSSTCVKVGMKWAKNPSDNKGIAGLIFSDNSIALGFSIFFWPGVVSEKRLNEVSGATRSRCQTCCLYTSIINVSRKRV